MPIYTVEIDGRRLRIEADTPDAAMDEAESWGQQQAASTYMQQSNQALQQAGGRPPPGTTAGAGVQFPERSASAGDTRPMPPPLPGSTTLRLPGGTATVGPRRQTVQQRRPDGPTRGVFDAADSATAFGRGALQTAATVANTVSNPLASIADTWQFVNRNAPVLAQPLTGRTNSQVSGDINTSEGWRRGTGLQTPGETSGETLARVLGDYQPSSEVAAVSGRAGAAAPFALSPGGILPTILGFLTGEGARYGSRAAGATDDQQETAATFGNIAGGMISTPGVRAAPHESMVREATSELTPNDFAAMRSRMEGAQALPGGGIRLGGDEVAAQAAPGRSRPLQTLMRQVARTPNGQRAVGRVTAERPGQVRATTEAVADQIAPRINDPAALSTRAQGAADTALLRMEQDRTNATRPLYAAADPQAVPTDALLDILTNATDRANSDQTGLVRGPMRGAIDNIDPAWDVENLSRYARNLRDAAEIPFGQPGALTRELSGAQGGLANSILSMLQENTALGPADARYAQLSRDTVDPAAAGPLGSIRGNALPSTADIKTQTAALYPAAPSEGYATNTTASLRALDAASPQPTPPAPPTSQTGTAVPVTMEPGPGLGAQMTRAHLVDALNRGTRRNQSGENPMGGANVANLIAGNAEQGATFRAGVQQVAPDAAPTVNTLIEALQATGTRLPEGSSTSGDAIGLENLGAMSAPAQAGVSISRPMSIAGDIRTWLRERQRNANAGRIVDMMTQDPAAFEATMLDLPNATRNRQITALIKALAAAQATESIDDRRTP